MRPTAICSKCRQRFTVTRRSPSCMKCKLYNGTFLYKEFVAIVVQKDLMELNDYLERWYGSTKATS